jgi:hypothetical protein
MPMTTPTRTSVSRRSIPKLPLAAGAAMALAPVVALAEPRDEVRDRAIAAFDCLTDEYHRGLAASWLEYYVEGVALRIAGGEDMSQRPCEPGETKKAAAS